MGQTEFPLNRYKWLIHLDVLPSGPAAATWPRPPVDASVHFHQTPAIRKTNNVNPTVQLDYRQERPFFLAAPLRRLCRKRAPFSDFTTYPAETATSFLVPRPGKPRRPAIPVRASRMRHPRAGPSDTCNFRRSPRQSSGAGSFHRSESSLRRATVRRSDSVWRKFLTPEFYFDYQLSD